MSPSAQPGMFGKLIGFMAMAVMLVLGFMFSLVLLGVVLIIGLGAFGYFWWKTRSVRREIREQAVAQAAHDGAIIDGEAVVVEESAQAEQAQLLVQSPERQA